MEPWWQGIANDFSDYSSLGEAARFAVRLFMAAALGGVVGYERQKTGKSAGLRTHMLVALGAALFVLIAQQIHLLPSDLSRVIQGVVSGIGFLGAGAIVKHAGEKDTVVGLTTAAGLWLTAAIGVAAGMGREISAIAAAVLAFAILDFLHQFEARLKPTDSSGSR